MVIKWSAGALEKYCRYDIENKLSRYNLRVFALVFMQSKTFYDFKACMHISNYLIFLRHFKYPQQLTLQKQD